MPVATKIPTMFNNQYEVPENLTVLDDNETIPPESCVFRVMSEKGDTRIVWNKKNIPEINDAKKTFQDLIAQGMVPHRVGINGKATSEEMSEFDPTAEEVIFLPVPVLAGG